LNVGSLANVASYLRDAGGETAGAGVDRAIDVVTLLQQELGQVPADEAARAGYQDSNSNHLSNQM